MPRTVEVLTYDGSIEIYRHSWTSAIDLSVCIKSLKDGIKRKYVFAKSHNKMVIDNLDAKTEYKVFIQAKRMIDKCIQLPRKIRLLPKTNQLRVIFIGSGRCGTTSIAHFLNGMRFSDREKAVARHETMFDAILPAFISKDYDTIQHIVKGFRHNIESAPHFALLTDFIDAKNTIHIIRDGRRVVQSGINRGWYQKDDIWNNSKPKFGGTIFEKCCKFWSYMTEKAESVCDRTFRLEDLSVSSDTINELLNILDIPSHSRSLPIANVGKKTSNFSNWNMDEIETFDRICRPMMDRYYPNWHSGF